MDGSDHVTDLLPGGLVRIMSQICDQGDQLGSCQICDQGD